MGGNPASAREESPSLIRSECKLDICHDCIASPIDAGGCAGQQMFQCEYFYYLYYSLHFLVWVCFLRLGVIPARELTGSLYRWEKHNWPVKPRWPVRTGDLLEEHPAAKHIKDRTGPFALHLIRVR